MAEFQELDSHSGRLFYAQNSVLPLSHRPTGYFRPRQPRPHLLHIRQLRDPLEKNSNSRRKTFRTFKFEKLANTREGAKRFFRLIGSPHAIQPTTSSTERSESRRNSQLSSGVPEAPSAVAGMVTVDVSHNEGRGTPIPGGFHRPLQLDTMRTDSTGSLQPSSSTQPFPGQLEETPIASGNGMSLSISLAEPVLFLQGFDKHIPNESSTVMLRGTFHLKVVKSSKVKSVTLKFRGLGETEWPEGIPPKKTEFKEIQGIINHTWPFFNAQFQSAELGHGADTYRPIKGPSTSAREIDAPGVTLSSFDFHRSRPREEILSTKEVRRLSLQANQTKSFGKGEQGNSIAKAGYRTFAPGDYIYNFELPIDSRLPETIDVELGSVKYELEAVVERSGAFRANLVGAKEVMLIRAPAESSLETVEPIAISRDWEDQLHYDIVISGKSFPLGAQVPIAFKLTPLAKVQCHRIKVYLTETIQYFTHKKRVHRLDPTRRLQLFEKRADGPSTSTYPGSTMRITSGGGVAYDARAAAAAGDESVPRDMTNLLGNLEGEFNVGPTEMEFNVQLPTCHAMQDKEKRARVHFDTTYESIQVHHWIKIVLRLSKPDPTDSTKRRHFEISIDSPFTILSCRATQAAIALPAYTSPESATLLTNYYECGCPGARQRVNNTSILSALSPSHTDLQNPSSASNDSTASLARPQAAHLIIDPNSGPARPIHLLRSPSYNPPAFSESELDPPPPLLTPPPKYESLVSGDPRQGLADYFARLADEIGDENEDVSMGARMDMPLTPGGRLNRSMDARRDWQSVMGA